MTSTPEFAHIEGELGHDLREALTLSKGWLEAALKNWKLLDDHEKESMVTAALFGTNRIGFLLDIIEGNKEETLPPAPERTADDLHRISNARRRLL